MTQTTTAPRPRPGRAPTILVEGLGKSYGSLAAVDDVDLEARSGSVVGLLGPNGAGKTTLIRMLLGLTVPTAGTARVLGAELGTPAFDRARPRVGAMIEGPSPYLALSGRRNVEVQARTLGLPDVAANVDRVLELVELSGRKRDRARSYSLGMKQRLGIAMALVGNPELLILDEPANGLDPAGIVDLRNLLRRLAETGLTVLVSSHQLAEVQQACDELVVMAQGRVVAAGTTRGLLDEHRGAGTIDVEVAAAEVAQAASALAVVGDVTVDGTTVTVTPRSASTGGHVNRTLFDAGVVAERVQPRRRTLEDVFLDLTADATPAGQGFDTRSLALATTTQEVAR